MKTSQEDKIIAGMSCRDAELAVLLKQTGELDLTQLKQLAAHIESCADCRKYEQDSGSAFEAARAGMLQGDPGGEIIDSIIRKAGRRPSRIFRFGFGQVVALAAAASVLVMAGWFAFNGTGKVTRMGMDEYAAILYVAEDAGFPVHIPGTGNGLGAEAEVDSLALELLAMEGLLEEEYAEEIYFETQPTSHAAPCPTDPRLRNSLSSRPEICG